MVKVGFGASESGHNIAGSSNNHNMNIQYSIKMIHLQNKQEDMPIGHHSLARNKQEL